MSTVYVLEPPTKGKVVVKTTFGPIDIELWPKEAPKAVRNFVQLCLEGYFDRTIFHRVIKSFLVQAGDPTGSGTGGESIYGAPFSDEFHSRLRFNHRGLVACANAGTPHSNGSQFFITLDRCEWLEKKNTIFGKVTGDSIFNLLRLGEVETDKDDRPLDPPPKILSVEVLWNPFEDIIPRRKPQLESKTEKEEKKKENKKGVKNINVLSFGEEVEEDEKEIEKDKIKSIHDVLNDPRFLKSEPLSEEQMEKKKETVMSVRETLSSKKADFKSHDINENNNNDYNNDDYDNINDNDDETMFDLKMRSQILKKRKELGEVPKLPTDKPSRKARKNSPPPKNKSSDDESENETHKAEKLSLKKKGIGSEAKKDRLFKNNSDLQLFNKSEQERQIKKQKKRQLQGRDESTLAKLERFKTSALKKDSDKSNIEESKGENEKDEDLSDWKSHKFVDTSQKNKGNMARREDPNDYVVFDPLLEKGKEKFNKMQAKLKKKNREWAGRSLT
ncbi:hypothetical protein LUZ60_008566 [Juncus effusus]|nr:hypothetical protein LUZ60_008566 [Juncus effusus]